jgi:hypothetical protein
MNEPLGTVEPLRTVVAFGENARKQGVHGDIAWSLQYVNGEESLVLTRAMVLEKSQSGMHRPIVVIGLSSAHKYTASNRKELGWIIRATKAYAEFLGFEPSRFIVHRLIDLIQKMLIELVTMKPMPDSLLPEQEHAELSIDGDGKFEVVLH